MFVNQALFESDKSNEDKLVEKVKNTVKQTKDIQGLLTVECWKRENKDLVEYAIVTKWTAKKDFIAWLSREDHVTEHKEMNKQKKQGISDKPIFKKTLLQFEAIELTDL